MKCRVSGIFVKGELMKKIKAVTPVCLVGIAVNFILFAVKLYIGLRSNSISVYSDAVNNFFDSLTALITLCALGYVSKHADESVAGSVGKTEQLLTFIISLVITFTGLYFAYNSLERMMYPTPVWFTTLYAVALGGTAAVKLVLFFVLGAVSKRDDSPVIRAIKFDSLLDFFITLMTIITLVVSNYGSYSFDALFGIVISAIIIITAIRMLISSGKILVNFVPSSVRQTVNGILEENNIEARHLNFATDGYDTVCYVSTGLTDNEILNKAADECLNITDIKIVFVKETN